MKPFLRVTGWGCIDRTVPWLKTVGIRVDFDRDIAVTKTTASSI